MQSIVILSGLDGCGKSTQIALLTQHLMEMGVKYKVVWARPGSTPFLLSLKRVARLIFKSLPRVGRSDKRSFMIKETLLGLLWRYVSACELLYIYLIKGAIDRLRGYTLIYDRHLIDASIDYELIVGKPTLIGKIFILISDLIPREYKIYLSISAEESENRCKQKYEPYPDTMEEKLIRHSHYIKYVCKYTFTIIDGRLNPVDINKIIRSGIFDNKKF